MSISETKSILCKIISIERARERCYIISKNYNYNLYLFSLYRMPTPQLPTWQDCHELWSKKRRRQLREQQESLPPGVICSAKYQQHGAAMVGDA